MKTEVILMPLSSSASPGKQQVENVSSKLQPLLGETLTVGSLPEAGRILNGPRFPAPGAHTRMVPMSGWRL